MLLHLCASHTSGIRKTWVWNDNFTFFRASWLDGSLTLTLAVGVERARFILGRVYRRLAQEVYSRGGEWFVTVIFIAGCEAPGKLKKFVIGFLLSDVERGESVVITRHGRAVARLVPERDLQQRNIDEAMDSIRRLRARTGRVREDEILTARDEGVKTDDFRFRRIRHGMLGVCEDHPIANTAFENLRYGDAVAPALWWFEVRNILVVNERRGRIGRADTELFLRELGQLRIRMDREPQENAVLRFAREQSLSVYDAAYLELAHREKLPIATLDPRLRDVALAAGGGGGVTGMKRRF